MARVLIASAQLCGGSLTVVAVWAILGGWSAALLVGVLLTVGGLVAERAWLDTR